MTKGINVLVPLVLVGAMLGVHCGGGGSSTPATAADTSAPAIASFTANPTSITAGQSATLTGVFSNGTGAIDQSVGAVTSGTAVTVTPAATTLYTLTVTASPGVSVSRGVTVTVTAGTVTPALPTPVITAPANLAAGLTGALAITATVADPTGVAAVDFQIDGADLGSAPTAPYTFTLPATGAYASGQHGFRARSRDGAGNTSPWSQAVVVSFGGTAALPSGFSLSALSGTLSAATAMGVAPDGRIFVCEQGGPLRVFKNGALLPAPFATLPTTANDERGLLGVTFDPQFAGNGFVYVYYTASSPTIHNRISRLTADPANADLMLAGSEHVLMDLPTLTNTNHNGGALHFGPDGKLYAAVGNNAINANSPSLATPLGKILRLNADGTFPADNPFIATTTGTSQAIWALGLRNPFTFGFQPGTARMHINDVGENSWEEVNLGTAGANYGWPSTEGPTTAAGITAPLFAYGHPSLPAGQPISTGTFLQGAAILGAAFDPSVSTWPSAYQGSYYFGDLVGGWVARMHLASLTVSTFATGLGSMRDLAFGLDGALYVLSQTGLAKITPP